jgi:2-haloalkanoic acid dehalogenase type II
MISTNSIKILTFDCYGTLIDWESAIVSNIRNIWPDIADNDESILQWFAGEEHKIQSQFPNLTYDLVLQEVIKKIGHHLEMSLTPQEIKAFGSSIQDWTPFDDTVEALTTLAEKYKLVIVSNIDNASIEATKKHLKVPFYKTFTAQNIGAYKPNHQVFGYVFEDLALDGYAKSDILHVAESLYHDHVPARELGLSSVWINRRFDKQGSGATPSVSKEFVPDLVFNDLISFARWL